MTVPLCKTKFWGQKLESPHNLAVTGVYIWTLQLHRKCDWLYPVEWSGYPPIFQWAQCSIMVENSFNNLLKVHEVNSFPWFFAKTAIKQHYWNSPPLVLGLSSFSFICNRYYFGICPYVDYLASVHNFRNNIVLILFLRNNVYARNKIFFPRGF